MVVWLVLGVAAIGLIATASRTGHQSVGAHAESIERRLKCPICDGESVAESNAEVSRTIRSDVERRLRAGQSDSHIIDAVEQAYPNTTLLPADSGLGLIAWGLPVVAVVLALAGLTFAFVRWRREPRLVATAEDEALVAEARDRAG
jgi:cytochrome c-type biogenesis protein CcmH